MTTRQVAELLSQHRTRSAASASLIQVDASDGEQRQTAGKDQQTLRDRYPVIVLLSGGQEVKRYEKEIAQAECRQDDPSDERQGVQRGSHAYTCCHTVPFGQSGKTRCRDRVRYLPRRGAIS
jgi:hypothetical protein